MKRRSFRERRRKMEQNRNKTASARLRRAAAFVAAAMLLQALFVVFFTPQGLSRVYPFVLRLKSETIEDDSSFAEYYTLRGEFADADSFFLGADTYVADSYFVILDYLRFTKRYFEVKNLALGVGESSAAKINACLAAPDAGLEEAFADFRSSGRYTKEFLDFVRSLCEFNKTLPPKRKLTVVPIYVESLDSAVVGRVTANIMSRLAKAPSEVSAALSISRAGEFFDHFDKNAEAFAEFLGEEEFSRLTGIEAHYRAGDYAEWALGERIAATVGEPTLYVVAPEMTSPDSPFRDQVAALGAKSAFVQIKYTGCFTLTSSGEVEKNDVDLPFAPKRGVMFVSGEKLDGFKAFYRFVADPAGDERKKDVAGALDSFSARHFFIVAGSPAAAYKEDRQ